MTTGLASGSRLAPAAARADIPDWVRIGAMVAILLVLLVGVDPFHDATSADSIRAPTGGNTLNQILYVLIGAGSVALIRHRGLSVLRPLSTVPILAMLAWLCVVCGTSIDPSVSFRRLVSLLIMMSAAVALLILARNVRQFAGVLGGTALAILLASYLGLVILPDRSIHSAIDLIEPEHVGSWRGVFSHKNAAGAMMNVFLYIGLFCIGMGRRVLGAAVVALAGIFLAFTYSKTSIAMAPAVLVLSWLCTVSTSIWWRRIVLLLPPLLLLTATVGSVIVPALGDVVARVAGDPTFTGRTDIWIFAVDNILHKPLTGFGYGAFWDSVIYGGGSDATTWVNQATDAHNGYLNTALEMGIPGLALTVWWFILGPVSDLQKGARGRRLDPIALLFLRLWLFGILAAAFETILYLATNGLFFLMTASVFGLRYRTTADLVREDGMGAPSQA